MKPFTNQIKKQIIIQIQVKNQPKATVLLPEKQKYSHEKGLEIVVPTEFSTVVNSYLPKCLEPQKRV